MTVMTDNQQQLQHQDKYDRGIRRMACAANASGVPLYRDPTRQRQAAADSPAHHEAARPGKCLHSWSQDLGRLCLPKPAPALPRQELCGCC